MSDPNYPLLLYLLGSSFAVVLKIAESMFMGSEMDWEEHPEQSVKDFKTFTSIVFWFTACAVPLHLAVFGVSPLAGAWLIGLVVWLLVLQDDPADTPYRTC